MSVVLQALLLYTPLATVFKIVPPGLMDLTVLLCAGALFALISFLYRFLADRWWVTDKYSP